MGIEAADAYGEQDVLEKAVVITQKIAAVEIGPVDIEAMGIGQQDGQQVPVD